MITKIKELRVKYDMTQQDVANAVNVRRETISFLEKGKYNPSLKLAVQIARLLKVSVEELFVFYDEELK
ncbi:helix-turn-helix transcriptional regulator [Mycoplasmatota bacterium WC44]